MRAMTSTSELSRRSPTLEHVQQLLLDIVTNVAGIEPERGVRRQRLQSFLSSCEDLKALLSQVWIGEWSASESLKARVKEIEGRLTTLMEDCTAWRSSRRTRQWIGADQELDEVLDDWKARVTSCWMLYQVNLSIELVATLTSRPVSIDPLLERKEVLPVLKGVEPVLRGVVAESNPVQKAELQDFIDRNGKTLQSQHTWTPEQATIFQALRSLLTVDTVPKSVQLTGEVLTIRTAVMKNRASYIDEGIFEEKRVAIKRPRDSDIKPARVERLLYEGAIWRMLHHPNILPFYGILRQPGEFGTTIGLVSEWAPNRDIMTFLKGSPDMDRPVLILGVIDGLVYLHGLGLIHGAIRGSNILVDQNHTPRLTDFALTSPGSGHGRVENPGPSGTEPCEIVRWLAPELMRGWNPTTATDIFSFGRTIFEIMIGGDPVYTEYNDLPLMMLCKLDQGTLRAKKPEEDVVRQRGLTDDVWNWLEEMWAFQPEHRPDIMLVQKTLQRFWSSSSEDTRFL